MTITQRTYGHGSITLTAYESSRRIRVEATAENSVMDWHELFEFVDAIRKPRQVTTVEELGALPIGSVVLSESYTHYLDGMRIAFQKWNDEAWHRYGRASDTHPDNFLPATVLHVGGAK